ncbi:nuclear transport factor 2 family protein [Luminiphilus sp.]|nr:nuclear transport factor 2 family protein [Luminiphilus sp.]
MSYRHVPIQDWVDLDNRFSAYTYLMNDEDTEGWIALYTEDGAFDVPGLNRFEGKG